MSVYGELLAKGMDAAEVAIRRGFKRFIIFLVIDALLFIGMATTIIYLLATR